MKNIGKVNRFIVGVEEILKIPPKELTKTDEIALRFNGFIHKSYCVRWGNGITYIRKLKAA